LACGLTHVTKNKKSAVEATMVNKNKNYPLIGKMLNKKLLFHM